MTKQTTQERMRRWPFTVLGLVFLVPLTLTGYVYYQLQQPLPVSEEESQDLAAVLVESIRVDDTASATTADLTHEWSVVYPDTVTMKIAGVAVYASIADSWPERIKGLSDTPYLPPEVVKLFVFDSPGFHSIWMKDMNYAIDILWLDESGSIVSVVAGATPESFPELFTPTVPALYVVETAAGFVATHAITVGDKVELPPGV